MKLRDNQSGFSPVEIILAFFVVVSISMVGWLVYDRQKKSTSPPTNSSKITTFDECVAAGYPVGESYPAVCIANGKTFTEPIEPRTEQDVTEN